HWCWRGACSTASATVDGSRAAPGHRPHTETPMSSILEREIAEQPEVVARLLAREAERVARIAAALPPFSYALIAARGTSDHAATYASYAWAALAGIPV